jgi:hypothetical protein
VAKKRPNNMLTAVSVETGGSDAINGTSQESDNLINSTESHEELIEHNNNDLVNNNTVNSTISSNTNHMDSHIVLHDNDTIDQNIDNQTIITECDNTSGMSLFLFFHLIYLIYMFLQLVFNVL